MGWRGVVIMSTSTPTQISNQKAAKTKEKTDIRREQHSKQANIS